MRNPGLYAVICSLSILLLSPACVVKKPDSGRISGLDYNKRVTVYDAHYRKKPTVFGISFVVAGTAAGGYLGYQSNLIGYQDGPDRKFVQPANAAIGALIGYSLTSLCNYALGQNKTYPATDVRKWAKDANKNYLLLSESSSSFTLIHNSAESSFLVKNIQDARDFRTCFPNSSYSNTIALQGASVVRREELPELLSLFPGNASASDMKSGFLAQSTSLAQCIEAKNKYPELSAEAERKASGYVSTLDDLRTFRNNFANSGYANEIVTNLYPRLKRAEMPPLVDMYPSLPVIPSVKSKYLSLGATVGECIDAKDKYPELKADAEQKAAGYVSSLSDLKAFKNSFPNSGYANDIVTRLYPKLSRSELPTVVELYPSLAIAGSVKKEYVNKSSGFDQFLEAINSYPKIVDNEEYRLANLVTNISTIRAFQNKFGSACEHIDLAFKNASGKINWIDIPDLVQATPNASEEIKNSSLNTYRSNLVNEFNNCGDAASCNSFISRFSRKFEADEWVKQTVVKYDYYSAKSISDWANYAAKYPEKMREADDKAFALTSATNSSSCDEYLRFFPSGLHLADAHDRWVSAIAYDMEQGVIALEKRVKEREYEENKWKGYSYCKLVITFIECIDQDDYTGSDRLWIYGFPRADRDYREADINISSGEKEILNLEVQIILDCQGYAYFYIEEVDIFGYGEINDEIARVNEHISEFNPRTEYIREFKNEDEGIHYKVGFKIIPYE